MISSPNFLLSTRVSGAVFCQKGLDLTWDIPRIPKHRVPGSKLGTPRVIDMVNTS